MPMNAIRNGILVLAALLGLTALPRPSPAQDAQDAQATKKRTAKECFERGRLRFDAGDFESAVGEFEKAYQISPHPAVLINIALCYERAGRIPEAVTALREYFKKPGASDQEQGLRSRLTELESRIGELQVACREVACAIFIDGEPRGEGSVRALVYPGKHRVEARFLDRPVARMDTEVIAGKQVEIELVIPAPLPPAALPPAGLAVVAHERAGPGPARAPARQGIPFWMAIGMTGASGISAIVFGVRTLQDQERFRDSQRQDASLKERGEQDRLLCNVFVGLTAVSAGTAAYFGLRHLWQRDPASIVVLPIAGAITGAQASFRF